MPTHNHGLLLRLAVASALSQTLSDIEVFIVGDGMTPETREAATALEESDGRVRVFDSPKGARHGELLRHEALRHASGDVVCYLSDDDLWLPDHIANARTALSEADFAHSLPTRVQIDGSLAVWTVDLTSEYYRAMLLGGTNAIPLTTAAHTLALYHRLPHGWRTTPDGTPTDLYMWQQILEADDVIAVSGFAPSALSFPAPERRHMAGDERLVELRKWASRMRDPLWSSTFHAEVLDLVATDRAAQHAARRVEADRFTATLADARGSEQRASQQVTELTLLNEALAKPRDEDQRQIVALLLGNEQAIDKLGDVEQELTAAYGTVTWRLRNALLRVPGLGRFYRLVARVLGPRP